MLFLTPALLIVASALCPYGHLSKRADLIPGSAEQKLNQVWTEILKQKGTSGSFYFAAGVRFLRQEMAPTIEYVSDKMPEGRQKLLNTEGVVAKAVFEAVENPEYTGMFQGSQYMIIRPSVGANVPKKESQLLPAVAVKFFRDNNVNILINQIKLIRKLYYYKKS